MEEVGKLLQEQEKENRLIAAICAAPIALKAHGIGKGKQITSYPAMKNELANEYKYLEDKVVTDGNNLLSNTFKSFIHIDINFDIFIGNLITSRGPATAFAFGLAIVEKLLNKETATTVAKGTLYDDYE